ncbi:hypothetical protein DFS34DRAFT_602005 [Phlyctochytrium arcticum]|nr:hypothetical protein DFS34DRAFT_602005 [Phlyctochytrium arcticum]
MTLNPLYYLLFEQKSLPGTLNPLDDYAAISVNDATQKALAGGSVQYEVRYPHDTGDRFVHFQKLCALAGVAYRNPHCFLCVHPVYGPWMALRAVIVIDQDGPSLTEPWHEVPNPCPQTNSEVVEMCARLREQVNAEDGPIAEALHKRTKQLIEIRDATGRYLESVEQYRYGSLQLNYHYTKDKRFLRDALQLRK